MIKTERGWRPYAGFKTAAIKKAFDGTKISKSHLADQQSAQARYYERTLQYLYDELAIRNEQALSTGSGE